MGKCENVCTSAELKHDFLNPPFGEANLELSTQPKRDAVERVEEKDKVSKHMIELKQCYQEEWAKILLCGLF